MPEIIKAAAGTFCWVESTSKEAAAAKKFYGGIFDWSFDETPMPGGQPYSRAMMGGRTVCGFYEMNVPAPFWLSYISVDDCDASAMKAQQLGAKVIKGPLDTGPGRYAIVEDPTGGMFALWQVRMPMQAPWLYGENNALCWNELMTTDTARAAKFYSAMFGWRADTMPMGGEQYTLFRTGPTQIGGMVKTKATQSAWAVHFQVLKADDTIARAQKNGASVVVPATDAESVGRWAMLKDPQGAAFGVIQRATRR